MRSRSRRKCAHMNAGDLGSILAVCACAYDPIHVTAQGKALGRTAHASYHHACMCLPMNACVLYPMPGIPLADWSKRGHVNTGDDVSMLMNHTPQKDNTPIVFLAL